MATETTEDRTHPAGEAAEEDVEELRAQVALLTAENRALREDRSRRYRTRYRRTAAGLAALGVLAGLAAVVFPTARNVLFALAATGLFGGLLTYYLAPERFVAATVGEAGYSAYADSLEDVVDELGLADARVYVPTGRDAGPARLFVPQHADYAIPETSDLESVFVVTEEPGERGLALHPTGAALLRELRTILSGPLAEEPTALADQLVDGLVEAFELADRATPDVEDGRATVGISGHAFEDGRRIDHPILSLLGVGLAVGLGRPVSVEVTEGADDRADYLITCRWQTPSDD